MRAKMIVYTAIFIALGIILPITFHYLGTGLGAVFLPMHLPVLLGGAILGSFPGIIIGILTPILSSIFTGMPPLVPMVPIMVLELGLFGLVIGYLYKNKNVNIYICLILTMIAGRIGAGIMVWILINIFGITQLPPDPFIYVWGSITSGIPGIIIQLILIPVIITYLKKSKNINMVSQNV